MRTYDRILRCGFQVALILSLLALSAGTGRAAPTLLGVFPGDTFFPDRQGLAILQAIDAWSSQAGGAKTTFAGMFIGIEDVDTACQVFSSDPFDSSCFNVYAQLKQAWGAGYTPFVKIGESGTARTAKQIADGAVDSRIAAWARAYRKWLEEGKSLGQERFAFLAPLPEANYCDQRQSVPGGTPLCITGSAHYTLDPASFKKAFRRIQAIFASEGVTRSSVRWVFAPNGYTTPGDPEFEEYYPGDDVVDAVGFSQYNQGYCYGTPFDSWLDPMTTPPQDQLFGEYIERLRALAPNRPIFVAQTATTAQSPAQGQFDDARKNQWLRNAYEYFADEGVAGVLYFNYPAPCDYEFFRLNGKKYEGYRQAVADPSYDYVPPAELADIALVPITGCTPTSSAHCLQGGRFRVEARWRDFDARTGSAPTVGTRTADSGLLYFYGPNNWEILVKVLDGCGANGNGHYWVFAAAATTLEYTLIVTDTLAEVARTYSNPLGNESPAITDTQAFGTCDAGGADADLSWNLAPPRSAAELLENPREVASATCTSGNQAHCLQNGRFRVEVMWRDSERATAPARTVAGGTADSGLFYFYGPNNWELLVKVLDDCGGSTQRFWVFAAAATTLEYTLKVVDTQTGAEKVYFNPLGQESPSITDTNAFATCS